MKRSGTRFGIKLPAVVAVVCAVGLAVAVPAAGHKVTYDSHLQLKVDAITTTTSQFSGKVTSQKGSCTAGRPVTVTVGGVFVATATSVAGGAWSATGSTPVKGSDVIATIPRKVLVRNKKHRHKCAPASAKKKAH